ncbi:MAG: fibronectin type III domain-containing protein [Candidatus Pacebacteria bacterium]|nr:fibronectin type III domain-containing protein [Candidatus Paceibacterota bacterium]
MKHKKHVNTILVVIILIGAFLIIRSAIVGQLQGNIKDADYAEDALQAASARCTAPSLASISVSNISNSGATVSWISSQSSTSAVKLGLASNNMNWLVELDAPASTNGVTSHTYQLSGLQASKKYYYRVKSSNGTCQKTSSTYSFTTIGSTGSTDITAPTVPSNLSASAVSNTNFVLSWNASTDPLISGYASGIKNYEVYGPAGACNSVHYNGLPSAGFCGFVNNTNASSYSMNISGLSPSTTYSGTGTNSGFVVMAFDNAGNYSSPTASRLTVTTTAVATVDVCPNIAGNQATVPAGYIIDASGNCVLLDTQAPTVPSGLSSPTKTSNSVSLSWNASTDNVGVIGYRVYMNGNLNGSPSGTSYTATGLNPATTYSFNVRAFDLAGNLSSASSSISVTTDSVTTVDLLPPTTPTGVSHSNTTSSSILLTWYNSNDDTLAPSQITYDVYGPTGACNASAGGGPIAGYCGQVIGNSSMQITGLTPSTQYNQASGVRSGFIVQAHDNAGHYSNPTSTYTSVTTPSAPLGTTTISNIQVSAITANSATITWTTSNPATGRVDYGVPSNYGNNLSNSTMSTSHFFALASLAPLTTYNFKVSSVDGSSVNVQSGNLTFNTPDAITTSCGSVPLKDQRQMWIWHDVIAMITAGSSDQNQLFDYIDAKNIDMIYISMPTSDINNNHTKLKAFLDTAWNDHCTLVQFLDGNESWITPNFSSAVAWATAAKNFDLSVTAGHVHPYGLNVDVEPYSALGTSTGRTNYINMFTAMKNAVAGTNLKIIAVIPRWYDTTHGTAFLQSVINASDELAIMNYVTNYPAFYNDAATELAMSQASGKKIVLGAETVDLRQWGGVNGPTSFWQNTCANLNTMLNDSYNSVIAAAPTSFAGYAIHDYYQQNGSGWRNLCP